MRLAFKNKVLVRPYRSLFNPSLLLIPLWVLLTIAAVISLALDFFQDFDPGQEHPVDCVGGLAIIVAVFFVARGLQLLPNVYRLTAAYKCNSWFP
jgi:hypothetical protein